MSDQCLQERSTGSTWDFTGGPVLTLLGSLLTLFLEAGDSLVWFLAVPSKADCEHRQTSCFAVTVRLPARSLAGRMPRLRRQGNKQKMQSSALLRFDALRAQGGGNRRSCAWRRRKTFSRNAQTWRVDPVLLGRRSVCAVTSVSNARHARKSRASRPSQRRTLIATSRGPRQRAHCLAPRMQPKGTERSGPDHRDPPRNRTGLSECDSGSAPRGTMHTRGKRRSGSGPGHSRSTCFTERHSLRSLWPESSSAQGLRCAEPFASSLPAASNPCACGVT